MIDFIIHFDDHLKTLIASQGPWIYPILMAIFFGETGLVILPFLPGDTLLIACGITAAENLLNPWLLSVLLPIGAILGDITNYWIARGFRRVVERGGKVPLVSEQLLARAHEVFEKHGGKAVLMGRWIPLVRTVVPFTAGLIKMSFKRFVAYSVAGNFLWVGLFLWAGYGFGHIKIVKENMPLVFMILFGCIVVSLTLGAMRHARMSNKAAAASGVHPSPTSPQ